MWNPIRRCLPKVRRARPAPARRKTRYAQFELEELGKRILLNNTPCVFQGLDPANPTDYNDVINWQARQMPDGSGTDTASIQAPCVLKSGNSTDISKLTVLAPFTIAGSATVVAAGTIGDGSTSIGVPGVGAGFLSVTGALTTNSLAVNIGNGTDSLQDPGVGLDDSGNVETQTMTSAAGATGGTTVEDGGLLKVDSSAALAGATVVLGHLDANTTDPFTGTTITLSGPASIGPGNVEGNLQVGPNSQIVFASSGGAQTFNAGATLGMGAGTVVFAGPVAMNATLIDQSSQLSLVPGGSIGGTGSIDTHEPFSWTGGVLGPANGVTLEGNSDFSTSGSGIKTLGTLLTNDSLTTNLGGSGTLFLGAPAGGAPGGSIVNDLGSIAVSLPMITNMAGGGGITNNATLDGQAPAATPTTISAPLTNSGTLSVTTGDALVLAPAAGADTLNGIVQLDGTLTLLGAFTSTAGFSQDAGGGTLLIGDGISGTGTLTVLAGETALLNGNLEVTSTGTLTGGGEVYNNGVLQLDAGATTGFGSYVQSSTGTLALTVVTGMGGTQTLPSPLTVTGVAQLSGTLKLLGYTPQVGDAFVVVRAGAIEHHFDTIPNGMTETDGPTSVTVTQTNPPA